jgi:hypothetical protein
VAIAPGKRADTSPLAGDAALILVVAFNRQILSGLYAVAADVWNGGPVAPLRFLLWSSALLSLEFFIIGLEGARATNRAGWIERGTWRDACVSAISRLLQIVDRFLFTADASNPKRSARPSPN